MIKKIACVFALILAAAFCASAPAAAGEAYEIGAGDVITISVWKNPDLTGQFTVLPDGTIHFPLLGELTVEGKSVGTLIDQMKGQLGKYVSEPEITISVMQTNSMIIYVIGKVNNPGRFPIQQDTIDVLQALAMAGGLNPFAKEKEVRIFRKAGAKTDIFMFNYDQVSLGEKLEQNIALKRGDVIVVR